MSATILPPEEWADSELCQDFDIEELKRLSGVPDRAPTGISLSDFLAYLPDHKFIHRPTRALWPAESLNDTLPWPSIEGKSVKPSKWISINDQIHQMTWSPGDPEIIEGRLIVDGGEIKHPGSRSYNLYRKPKTIPGDPEDVDPWYRHLVAVYPSDWEHILCWFAQRVQHPEIKLNHALVLGGPPGIGKDTLIEPVVHGIGQWNFAEINPEQMLGRFNGWLKSVIVRVNESHDLGGVDRFSFHDHAKTYIAAPPEVLRIDEKHCREYPILNRTGVLITTNHKLDGLYLPPDDRRHYVAWSDVTREKFSSDYWQEIWNWYENGGIGNVIAYLKSIDLTSFDPKATPPRTAAFDAIVACNSSADEADLADLIERVGSPVVVTPKSLSYQATTHQLHDLAEKLASNRFARKIAHQLDRAGYEMMPNPYAKDRRWRTRTGKVTAYAAKGSSADQRQDGLAAIGINP